MKIVNSNKNYLIGQFDTSKLEKETTQVKSDTEWDLARVGTDPNIK